MPTCPTVWPARAETEVVALKDPSPAALPRDEFWNPRRVDRWTWWFVGLGAAALSIRYLLCFPLFLDEAFLSVNYLDRGPAALIGPLDYRQVCPLGFLWVQWTIQSLLGFTEYALRLFPLVCGLASLAAFRHLAGLVLAGQDRLLAVGIFSAAYPLVRYSSQAKPYSADVLVAVLLLIAAVRWRGDAPRQRWLWIAAALVPIGLSVCFAPVFVAGAVALAAVPGLCSRPCLRAWLAWLAYSLSLVASLGVLFVLSAGTQWRASGEFMEWYWGREGAFPPLDDLGKLATWLLKQHTGDMAAYPVGGRNYGSTATLVCALAGLGALLRRRQFFVVSLCLVPLAANFAAACLKAYPYGSHVRVMLYAAPLVCLPAGAGAAALLKRVPTLRRHRHVPVLVTALLLTALAVAWPVRDFLRPYKMEFCRENRDFARWFWASKSRDAEVACLDSDWNLRFRGEPIQGMPWSDLPNAADLFDTSSLFRANRAIYRPATGPPDLARVSGQHPLRCVHFRSWSSDYDEAGLGRWLDEMQSQYRLVGRETHRFPISWLQLDDRYDRVELFEFVPK